MGEADILRWVRQIYRDGRGRSIEVGKADLLRWLRRSIEMVEADLLRWMRQIH